MDEDAFEALWYEHYADILTFCLRRLGDRHEAADATAETFLIAWRRSSELAENPRPWLFGVALKVIANSRRGGRRRGALALRLGATASPAFAAQPDDAPGEILAAFRTLAPADQQILS